MKEKYIRKLVNKHTWSINTVRNFSFSFDLEYPIKLLLKLLSSKIHIYTQGQDTPSKCLVMVVLSLFG